jgi:alpha-1,2-glucosyltransferase
MTGGRSRKIALALGLALLAGQTFWALRLVGRLGRYSDEFHHLRQILRFCRGEWLQDPKLTVLPAYHALATLWATALGGCTLDRVRTLSAAASLLVAYACYRAACRLRLPHPEARALLCVFLPVLVPYHVLAYTDSVSLAANVVTFSLLLGERPRLAGLVAGASILIRQTNAVWAVLVCLVVITESRAWTAGWSSLRDLARRLWPAALSLTAFGVFVIWNGGVAVGSRGDHRPGFYSGNVFFALFLLGVCALPLVAWTLFEQRRRLLEPRLLALLAAAGLLFAGSFRADHPSNRIPGFLRNDLVAWVVSDPAIAAAFFVPVAAALATLYLTPLARPSLWVIYPAALLALVPARLIEHRYAIPWLVLFLLCRRGAPAPVEWASVVLSVLLGDLLLAGIVRSLFWI